MTFAATSSTAVRVGFFLGTPGDGWMGGLNYFLDLFAAIRAAEVEDIVPVVFLTSGTSTEVIAQLVGVGAEVHLVENPMRRNLLAFAKNQNRVRKLMIKCVIEHRLDVLSHSPVVDLRAFVPTLSWFPDFQHVELPQLFTLRDRLSRSMVVRRAAKYSDRVLLSSRSALKNLGQIAPGCAKKAVVLRFRKRAPTEVDIPTLEVLRLQHGIPARFFYLPNQFWTHKDHETAIRALDILCKRGERTMIVCTGSTSDHRNSNHFENLSTLVRSLGLESKFMVLGLVARASCWGLMRHAIAVLNPSRFEGWSSTVEEARALGVNTILSDIDVHREQAPVGSLFFEAGNEASLADRMQHLMNAECAAHPRTDASFLEFGRAYAAIIGEVASSRSVFRAPQRDQAC
jgi:glycosyltransferase involved in cell wall biosynthesis